MSTYRDMFVGIFDQYLVFRFLVNQPQLGPRLFKNIVGAFVRAISVKTAPEAGHNSQGVFSV
jgi:hypothetical protein